MPRHRRVTGQGREASPILHDALGSSKWSGSPPAQAPPVLRMLKVSQNRAPSQCETGLRLRFQSVRFTFCCVSIQSKDIPVMCQLYTAFLFHIHLCCQHSTGLLQRVFMEKECTPAFFPHLRLLCLWIETGPRQCKGRKG